MGGTSQDTAIDMTGTRSGKLTVIKRGTGPDPKRAYWLCKCDCGKDHTVMGKYLRTQEVKSCGCLNRTSLISRITHGLTPANKTKPRVYTSWAGVKSRCLNPNDHKWPLYGGRGIKVCARWMKFENFLADMGHPPPGTSLDRINVNGDYKKSNCRWATPKQQANNTRFNRWITHHRQRLTLSQWAEKLSVSPSTLHGRVKRQGEHVALDYYITKLRK